ncbi:MAG: hypothetical protein LBS07_01200 [Prevotellaceae bacterium]|nr:hypothetical protein [Prevotellaceae bacterium]
MKNLFFKLLIPCIFVCCSPDKKLKEDNIELHISDRLIAHGGGMIDGHTYTNSLEALDLSYSMGCKLFELDIIQTSDGKFVSAHDWKHFKKITDYQGAIDDEALSQKEYLSLKIFDKYTPMNMPLINDWFMAHKDATLVTDKVNTPKEFTGEGGFLFKERLIMELFSWEAVKEAIETGITPMVSENLIFAEADSIIEKKLAGMNIQYTGISRQRIEANKDFLIRLKEKGVKTFVFHVNFGKQYDEQYVWENEMQYIYGMYADKLDLLQEQK